MKITDLPFAVLRMQYQLARFPLQVIEDRVVGRLDAEAPARLFYERSLGMLDLAVGNALSAPEVEQRGAALVERSEALRRAAALDTAAEQARDQADAELQETAEQAKRERQQTREEKQREVAEARETAQKRKQDAAQSAQKRTAAAKKQADQVAAARIKSAEELRKQEEAEIRAAEKSVEAVAEAKLDDAGDKKAEAAERRATAERVEDLADAEKENRQAQNASTNGSPS
ncbi:IF2 family translation initiation factor [Mycobacterium sp. WMMD1722]|uniref:IF2 family translation initiation factor n=1 Tax=Mycobacterium sp. WMMD1722 TaxID=3404117 RepID=UPI003BF4A8A7